MNKFIFLDRDGTLNVDYGWVCSRDHWTFTERAVEALERFSDAGYQLAIVTNQGGIALGKYKKEDVEELHEWLLEELWERDIHAQIAYCPHILDPNCSCGCRKPAVGMARQIEEFAGVIDYENSWMIGDKLTDHRFGKNLGMKTALITSRYWDDDPGADLVVRSLWEAAERILV